MDFPTTKDQRTHGMRSIHPGFAKSSRVGLRVTQRDNPLTSNAHATFVPPSVIRQHKHEHVATMEQPLSHVPDPSPLLSTCPDGSKIFVRLPFLNTCTEPILSIGAKKWAAQTNTNEVQTASIFWPRGPYKPTQTCPNTMYYSHTLFHSLIGKHKEANQHGPVADMNYQDDHKGNQLRTKESTDLNLSSFTPTPDSKEAGSLSNVRKLIGRKVHLSSESTDLVVPKMICTLRIWKTSSEIVTFQTVCMIMLLTLMRCWSTYCDGDC